MQAGEGKQEGKLDEVFESGAPGEGRFSPSAAL